MLGTTIEFDANNLVHNNAIIFEIKGGKVVDPGHEQDLIVGHEGLSWTVFVASFC